MTVLSERQEPARPSSGRLGRFSSALRSIEVAWDTCCRLTAGRAWLGDTIAAGLYLAGCFAEIADAKPHAHPYRALDVLGVLLVLAGGMALLGQRRFPASALLVTASVSVALSSAGYVSESPFGSVGLSVPTAGAGVALYALSLRQGRPRSVIMLTAALVVGLVVVIVLPGTSVGAVVAVVLAMGIAWALGDAQRARRAHTESLRARAERLEREQHVLAEIAVAQERARIARELHDVVAHHLSLMIVNAAAADRQLERSPAVARGILTELVGTGQAAVTEMRRLLTVLRSDDDPWQDRHPQPTFASLDELVDTFRAAGLVVDLTRRGPSRPLAAGLDLTAYRVVQESLTNTLRHAGTGTRVSLDVEFSEEALVLRIRDDGVGTPADAASRGSGHGLIGMRERINLVRGELATGPVEGGFLVSASLPLTGEVR